MDYHNLYNTNADFKQYVDRYCKQYKVTADEALKHLIVQGVGDAYAEDSKRIFCEEKKGYGC